MQFQSAVCSVTGATTKLDDEHTNEELHSLKSITFQRFGSTLTFPLKQTCPYHLFRL